LPPIKRRIADNEIGPRPSRRLDAQEPHDFDPRVFAGHHLASNRMRSFGSPIPAGQRAPIGAAHKFLALPDQQRVAMFDVPEIT